MAAPFQSAREPVYQPSPWGAKFHALGWYNHKRYGRIWINEGLGAGSAGPGKTTALIMEPVQQIIVEHERCTNKKHPHHQSWGTSTGWALFLRRTFRMIEQTVGRTQRIFPLLDPGAKWHQATMTWTFSSGYRYQFGHCAERNDWEQYYSNEYTIILFDELVQFEEEQYKQIISRLRSSDAVLRTMLKVRSMSNPVMRQEGGENVVLKGDPHWVRKRFVDPHPSGNKVLVRPLKRSDGTLAGYWSRIYCPAKLDVNPNKDFVRDYEINLLNMAPHMRAALLDGNWYVTAGSFYGEVWNESIHTCEPFRIPDHWPQFRAMDWGFKHPGIIGWFAMDDDGNLFMHRECVFRKKTDVQVAGMVQAIEDDLGLWGSKKSLITGPADTQLWENRGVSAKPMAQVFHEHGVPWSPADKNWKLGDAGGRVANAQRLLKRLMDHDHGTTTPGIVFFRTCNKTIQTLPAIQTDPDNLEAPATGGYDHPHDMVCYAVAYASRGSGGIAHVRDDDEDDDEDREPQKRGPWGWGHGY